MTTFEIARSRPTIVVRGAARWRRTARRLAALALAAAALPGAADAQLGRLKKLKNAVRPDSATRVESRARDSLATSTRDSVAPADTAKGRRSRLMRAASAARKAADKFEDVTGVSATDAALMASGVGAPGVVAKKLGVDPKAVAANAIGSAAANRAARAQSRAGAGAPTTPSMPPGGAGMPDLARMQSVLAGPRGKGAVPAGAGVSVPGLTAADTEAMIAFQREMMQVALAASGGDAAAQARLEAWEAIALEHQPEIERMTLAAHAGDVTTISRMQRLQLDMMRAWSRTSAPTRKVVAPAGVKRGKP